MMPNLAVYDLNYKGTKVDLVRLLETATRLLGQTSRTEKRKGRDELILYVRRYDFLGFVIARHVCYCLAYA